MEIEKIENVARCEFVLGTLEGQPVVLVRCGMGKVNAASCASVMINRYGAEIIINTGVGGALDPTLKVLDILIARDAVQHDYDVVSLGYQLAQVDNFDTPYFLFDERVNHSIHQSAEAFGYRTEFARFATGDRFIDDPAEKVRLLTTFGARVCDMESGAIAQICALHGVRCASIRTISDSGSGTDGAMQFQQFLKLASTHSVFVIEDMLRNADRIL